VPREEAEKQGFYWLCGNCEHPELHALVRRRFVERCPDEKLERWAQAVRAHQ
jgi:hypothetical protein